MLKNYLKVALRNLWKSKTFSLINIFGLSVGISFALLVGSYVWGELQVNHSLKNVDNQYIILSKWTDPDMGSEFNSIALLAISLKNNYPNLVANYYNSQGTVTNVTKGERHFRESLQVGDSTLLNMYGFKLLNGTAETALREPFSVVITPKMALKYFGKTDVTGQTLNFEGFSGDNHDFMITGVLDELPLNTITRTGANTQNFFFNTSASKFFKRDFGGWDNASAVCHIELQKSVNAKVIEKLMLRLLKSNAPEEITKNLTPYLIKLKDYNLVANNGLVKKMTWTISSIALFILLMAVINFVNICIGHSSGRMKEMGLRKVMGGLRIHLILQFLIESILIVVIATFLAVFMYIVSRPYFSLVLGKDIMGLFDFPAYFVIIVFVFALLVGLAAGIYPAFVLSALKSVDSLKGKISSVKENLLFRKVLVAFQFITAIIVFAGSLIISQQISLFFSKDLGYNKDYVIYAQLPRDWSTKGVQKMEAIRTRLAQVPELSSIALSFEIPDGRNEGNAPLYRQDFNILEPITTQVLTSDNHFAEVYDIPLKAGTFFKPLLHKEDSNQVVINETESKAIGWKDPVSAVGQKIILQGTPYTVCGVTADFHFGSMQAKILPVTFVNVNFSPYYRYFSFRLRPNNIQKSIQALGKNWAEVLPGAPFDYHFMDEALIRLYANEIQLKKATYIATVLATLIVLLGVFGLISLSIQKRTKEIGIRKILGSSSIDITLLFLKDFFQIILFATVVACPLIYLIMQFWLNGYAYRINISSSPFILSIGLLATLMSILIIAKTTKAAFANPVKSLRT